MWNLEDVRSAEALKHKEINVPDPNGSESLTSSLCKYFHLWKMPLPRILLTLLGRTQLALSLRRCSVVLQLKLFSVVMMLKQQSTRVKKGPTSWMIKWGEKTRNSLIVIYLKPYKGLTPAGTSWAVILALCFISHYCNHFWSYCF